HYLSPVVCRWIWLELAAAIAHYPCANWCTLDGDAYLILTGDGLFNTGGNKPEHTNGAVVCRRHQSCPCCGLSCLYCAIDGSDYSGRTMGRDDSILKQCG